MYKDQMDGNTILFLGDTYCKAYSLSYINKNYNLVNSSLQDVKEIYYKCNSSKSSWINYKKALLKESNRNLNYIQRIKLGLLNDTIDANTIPETEYTDYLGFTYKIGAGDGANITTNIKPLLKVLSTNISKSTYYDDDHGNIVTVDFKTDITNAIIIFNGLFEPYHIVNKTTVEYYQNESSIPFDSEMKLRLDWCQFVPYIWDNLYIKDVLKPVKFDGTWLVFNEPIDSGSLLFYNNVMYFYEINKMNNKYIRISDLDVGNSNNFFSNHDNIKVVRFVDENQRLVKQQKLVGFFNESDCKVYFPSNISNAIITYNGTHSNYIITPDQKAIKFTIPTDINLDINTGIDEGSKIYAINFFSYTDDELFSNSFNNYNLPQVELAKVANDVLNNYKDTINNQKEQILKLQKEQDLIFDDYEETLIYNEDNPNMFKLRFVPQDESIRLHINGVHYEKDVYFRFISEKNSIEWLFTEREGGFDIKPNMLVNAIYDFGYIENGFNTPESIKEFKDDYNKSKLNN